MLIKNVCCKYLEVSTTFILFKTITKKKLAENKTLTYTKDVNHFMETMIHWEVVKLVK